MHSCRATAVMLAAGVLVGAAGASSAAEPVATSAAISTGAAATNTSARPSGCASLEMDASDANDPGGATGDTPLSRAVAAKDFWQVQTMIRCGADPQLKSGDGWYPIHTAAYVRSPAMVELLARQGANPNVRGDYLGWTPLHVAVQDKANAEVVKALLAHGANPAIADTRGETPYDLARAAGRTNLAALLKRR